MAAQPLSVDHRRTAVVIMDFQNGIVNGVARDPRGTVERAAAALAPAPAPGAPVMHTVHRAGRFDADPPDAATHPGVAPA